QPQAPVSATLKRLEFTHGYNLLTLNALRRGAPRGPNLIPYVGAILLAAARSPPISARINCLPVLRCISAHATPFPPRPELFRGL
ncbi:MAG: hypothetical protein WBB72_02430, partial [Methyloceanibacter sp.]